MRRSFGKAPKLYGSIMNPNKYKKIKNVFMVFFTVIAVIDLILFKGGSTSLENALGETMGVHAGRYHLITGFYS